MSFSPEEKRLLKRLAKKLPRLPLPGWERDRILDELGLAETEESWRKILKVIFKCKKVVELRQPGLPLIKYASGGYQLIGSTGKNGRLRLS